MPPASRRPSRTVVAPLLIQALLWIVLTVASAALLRLAGSQSWLTALHFSALNWIPWIVVAPIVFWFSGKFPVERGHLWRSVPAHVIAGLVCVAATVWVATYVGYWTRPTSTHFEERRLLFERERAAAARQAAGGQPSTGAVAAAPDTTAPTPPAFEAAPPNALRDDRAILDRGDRFGHGHPPFGRRGPFSWPLIGTTLLRVNFGAAVYLIVVVAAHAFAFYRRAQERDRQAIALTAGLSRAKLDALRLQLQPHFLFNTLNAISTLVHRDASAADELIGDLSELLRLSLQTTEHEVPLARELELLDRYIAIEQARLGDRLRVVREIDAAAVGAYVPTFVLQPLVENAIRHGIEPRLAPGTVTIRARREGAVLRLSVTDDGIGLPGQPAVGPTRSGIGISNTEARLQALHGAAARLAIGPGPAGGVEVVVLLPYATAPRPQTGAAAPAAPA